MAGYWGNILISILNCTVRAAGEGDFCTHSNNSAGVGILAPPGSCRCLGKVGMRFGIAVNFLNLLQSQRVEGHSFPVKVADGGVGHRIVADDDVAVFADGHIQFYHLHSQSDGVAKTLNGIFRQGGPGPPVSLNLNLGHGKAPG